MYQLTVSVDSANASWLYSVEDLVKSKLKDCYAVSALSVSGRRLYCGFGCEACNRVKLNAAVKEGLVEMYAVISKFDFVKHNLALSLPSLRYDMLLHTLVAFDRENEHKLLNKLVNVKNGMALDGVFNFKMGELKDRWLEICKLTRTNGAYLYDDETYNELLRFLISAVNPKVNKLTVCEYNGKYRITGALKNSILDLNAVDIAELMYYLIDLAPLELFIDGSITNGELYRRLTGIFDAKTINTYKNKTKN